jgi:sigma-B regulation protein RsbU (phosphoserine phosphatase)
MLGGDCWGIRPLSNTQLAIFTYDFSGHGMTAAMNVFRMHTIMQEYFESAREPGNYLTTINRQLQPLLERDQFATMFYGIIDTDANCLMYASAATPAPILLNADLQNASFLNGRGFPLGVVPKANYETPYAAFMPGDTLLLYSDCVIETPNNAGEFLSEEILLGTLHAACTNQHSNHASAAIAELLARLQVHSNHPIIDDLTITAYSRNQSK